MIGLSRLGYQHRLYGQRLASSFVVDAGTPLIQTLVVPVSQKTDSIVVRIKRPTTAVPRAWDDTGVILVRIKYTVDGVEHLCQGRATGGIRTTPNGEMPEYRLYYRPTWGYFGQGPGSTAKRIGEGAASCQVHVEIERSAGSVQTEVEVAVTHSDAPTNPFTNSVAYDNATDAGEASGDGTLTLSHTASGSNRAAFIGVGNGAFTTPGASTPPTYASNSSTELWDTTAAGFIGSAGNYIKEANIPTGAQTVSSTLTGFADLFDHYLSVVSFTGVDQTTSVGTPATASGNSSTPSVSVTDATSGDMVVDLVVYNGSPLSIGANQTLRNDQTVSMYFASSTQAGADGGVMSWSDISTGDWLSGAVTMKQTAAGGRTTKNTRSWPLGSEVGMNWRGQG